MSQFFASFLYLKFRGRKGTKILQKNRGLQTVNCTERKGLTKKNNDSYLQ